VAADTRSQVQNRALAEERLAALVKQALVVPKVRRPTAPTRASRERRLDAKRRQGERKRDRRSRDDD
jgi:ribosome-associated protein